MIHSYGGDFVYNQNSVSVGKIVDLFDVRIMTRPYRICVDPFKKFEIFHVHGGACSFAENKKIFVHSETFEVYRSVVNIKSLFVVTYLADPERGLVKVVVRFDGNGVKFGLADIPEFGVGNIENNLLCLARIYDFPGDDRIVAADYEFNGGSLG